MVLPRSGRLAVVTTDTFLWPKKTGPTRRTVIAVAKGTMCFVCDDTDGIVMLAQAGLGEWYANDDDWM